MRELHGLHQQVQAGEGQSAEGLDCTEWELQNLSLMLQLQPTSTPTPTETFVQVIYVSTLTHCAPCRNKQT